VHEDALTRRVWGRTIILRTVVFNYHPLNMEPAEIKRRWFNPIASVIGRNAQNPMPAAKADAIESNKTVIITVYRPDTVRWENDFRTRRLS